MTSLDEELSPRGWERYREVMAAPTSRPLPSFVPIEDGLPLADKIRAATECVIAAFVSKKSESLADWVIELFAFRTRLAIEKAIALLSVEKGGQSPKAEGRGSGVKDHE